MYVRACSGVGCVAKPRTCGACSCRHGVHAMSCATEKFELRSLTRPPPSVENLILATARVSLFRPWSWSERGLCVAYFVTCCGIDGQSDLLSVSSALSLSGKIKNKIKKEEEEEEEKEEEKRIFIYLQPALLLLLLLLLFFFFFFFFIADVFIARSIYLFIYPMPQTAFITESVNWLGWFLIDRVDWKAHFTFWIFAYLPLAKHSCQ